MNEILKDKLRIIAGDDVTLEAIKVVFNDRIEKELPDIEKTDDNQMVGENYRAYKQAKKIIEDTLIDIDSYKEAKVGKTQFNKEI